MLASLMVHEWATPLNLSAPIAGILTIGGFLWAITVYLGSFKVIP